MKKYKFQVMVKDYEIKIWDIKAKDFYGALKQVENRGIIKSRMVDCLLPNGQLLPVERFDNYCEE